MVKALLVPIVAASILFLGCTARESAEETSAAAELPPADAVSTEAPSEEELLHKADPEGTYGGGITLAESTPIAELLAGPEAFEGKTVVVVGTVAEVCPRRGCWIDLAGDGPEETIRVKVTDGDIVFPLSARGRRARVEGRLEKLEMNEEETRAWKAHEAEERGETFDPASVTGPSVTWRIKGAGAEIRS